MLTYLRNNSDACGDVITDTSHPYGIVLQQQIVPSIHALYNSSHILMHSYGIPPPMMPPSKFRTNNVWVTRFLKLYRILQLNRRITKLIIPLAFDDLYASGYPPRLILNT